jgi:hypothetical protein
VAVTDQGKAFAEAIMACCPKPHKKLGEKMLAGNQLRGDWEWCSAIMDWVIPVHLRNTGISAYRKRYRSKGIAQARRAGGKRA